MANAFTKTDKVAFDEMLAGFEDALVMARNVNVYRPNPTEMIRANDTIWRPQPYILPSYNGTDQSANFKDRTQLSVPASINVIKSVPWTLSSEDLNDPMQEDRLRKASAARLSSDINTAILTTAANYGSMVVKRTTAATGFDDVAAIEAPMNESGVPMYDRYLALTTRDYNGMAADLAKNTRSFGNSKSDKAYEKGYVGMVDSFDTYKLDIGRRLAAAAGGGAITIDTQAAAANYHVPKATTTATTGETSNYDNRFQTITVSATANVVAGDCFTIAGITNVHQITKGDTGQLKTFRVVSVTDGTHMVVTPPIISNQGASAAEEQYQNCIVDESAAAAIVFLNTAAAGVNCFWFKDAFEILPGRFATPANSGISVLRATVDPGFEVEMTKWTVGETKEVRYRTDVKFGTVCLNTEMAGIILFSQS